jgi:O-antigen/teichoic acid export membrane protein
VPKEYGIAATYQMCVTLIALIIGFELNRYLDIYYFKVSKEKFEEYLSTIISTVLVSSTIGFVLLLFIMQFINIPNISYIWIVTIPLIVIFKFVFGINDTLLRNEERALAYGKYTISETFIFSVGALMLAYFFHSWTSKAYSFLAAMFILGIFSYYRLKVEYNLRFYLDKQILKKAFIYSAPFVFGLNLANIIFANSDKIILLHFYDYSVVGIFAVAFVFASITGFVTDSFMKAWTPVFYKKLQANDKNVDKQSFYVFAGLGLVSLVSIYFLTLIMPYMINEKYYDALDVMPYIAFGYIFRVGEQLLLYYINFYEQTNVLYGVVVLTILSSIVFAYFLVQEYGMIGMAISINIFFIFKIGYYFNIVRKIRKGI